MLFLIYVLYFEFYEGLRRLTYPLYSRLVLENAAEKKHIKSLNATIESLETKCEEFQSSIDDLHVQIDILKRRSLRNSSEPETKAIRNERINLRNSENRLDDNDGKQSSPGCPQTKEVSTFIYYFSHSLK